MFWTRFLLDEVRDVNDQPLRHGPASIDPETLTAFIEHAGGTILSSLPRYHAIRASLPLEQVEAVAQKEKEKEERVTVTVVVAVAEVGWARSVSVP